jgi:hypothetical protein
MCARNESIYKVKGLARDKQSVNYGCKKFYSTGGRCNCNFLAYAHLNNLLKIFNFVHRSTKGRNMINIQ